MKKTAIIEEKAHALYSPSSASRWLGCAGSINLSKQAPPQRDSAAASEGTAAHAVAERDLNGDPDAYEAVMGYMAEDIRKFTSYVRTLKDRASYDELLVETKVKLNFIHEELSGTIDVGLVKVYDTLHAIDLKYGRGYVNHINNPQLLIYVIGLAHEYNYDFADYHTTIYQPRSTGKTARTATYSNKDLRKYVEVLKRGVDACEKPSAPLVTGKWCHFCPAKVICPAISKNTLASAKLDFDDEIQPAPKDLSIDNLRALLDKAYYLKLWVAEIESYAEAELARGKKIEGYSLVPTRPTVKWQNESKLIKFIEANKLEEAFYNRELLSPANARKFLSKKLSDKRLEKFLSLYTVAVSSGYKLNNTNDTSLDFSLDDEN